MLINVKDIGVFPLGIDLILESTRFFRILPSDSFPVELYEVSLGYRGSPLHVSISLSSGGFCYHVEESLLVSRSTGLMGYLVTKEQSLSNSQDLFSSLYSGFGYGVILTSFDKYRPPARYAYDPVSGYRFTSRAEDGLFVEAVSSMEMIVTEGSIPKLVEMSASGNFLVKFLASSRLRV